MFETIWSKKEYVDRDNQEALNMIAAEEATCSDFPISCQQRYGAWGIWFIDEEDYLLINPLDLVNSIYEDDVYYMLEESCSNETPQTEGHYVVAVYKWLHCFSWRILHSQSNSMRQFQFTYKDYIGKIKQCVQKLYDVLVTGEEVVYQTIDANIENIEICIKQLDRSEVAPSNYRLMANSISPETFIFQPLKGDWIEHYEIGIGDRSYKTWLTHWDNDMELIRHQFEAYVFNKKATIELNFDGTPTILKFSHHTILNEHIDTGDGYRYTYKDYILVEIIPNGSAFMPIIKGYCEEKATIRTLYEGLLYMASIHPEDGKENPEDNIPSKLTAYNRYKSPIIESFLKGNVPEPNTYRSRQIHINEILRIEPDVNSYIWDKEGAGGSVNCYDDKDGNPIEMEEFDKWAYEIEAIVIASETGEPYEKDWDDYHRRGLALAHKLRERLPMSTDLWYAAPYEDKSGTIKHPILILLEMNRSTSYITKAKEYCDLLQEFSEGNNEYDRLFDVLDCLKLDSNYTLALHLANDNNGIGDVSWFYCYEGDNDIYRDRFNNPDRDIDDVFFQCFGNLSEFEIFNQLSVEKSEMGAWQAFLLSISLSQLPCCWHGAYRKKKLIFTNEGKIWKELSALNNLGRHKEVDFTIPEEDLIPEVWLEANMAYVRYCYFNMWKGIVRETTALQFDQNRVINFKIVKSETLWKYNCGLKL